MRKPKPRKLNPNGISYTAFLVGSVALFAPVLGLVYAADQKKTGYTEPSGGPSDVGDIESPVVSREELVACQQSLDSSTSEYKYMRIIAVGASLVAVASLIFNYMQAQSKKTMRTRYRSALIHG